jgi:LPXTG-motif cell wall-anchored protein
MPGNGLPSGRRRAFVLGVTFTLAGAASLAGALIASTAGATQPNPEHKVTLCHRTDSYTNPYVVITVDVASVHFEGHDGHDGPVFNPGIPHNDKWGDIIPPFDFGPDEQYAGKNWPEGQSIFDADCELPAPATTTTTCPGTTTTEPVATTTTTEPAATTTTTTHAPATTTSSTSAVLATSATTASATRVSAPPVTSAATPTGATLPRTGSAFDGILAAIGVAMLAMGGGLVRIARRPLEL